VLAIAAVLAAVAAPTASRTIDRARLSRAVTDTQAIRTAVHTFLTEFTVFAPAGFTSTGDAAGDTIELLVGDGDVPANDLGAAANNWDDVVNCCAAAVDVAFIEGHLATNTSLGGAGTYSVAAGGWRGAYMNAPIDPDPWGNRYAVNVEWLRTAPSSNDVFVLSAGPDEALDTAYAVNGAVPGDDDIIAVVRRDAGLVVP
jgi:type II secretory pathway pseudopilin PulG